MTTPHNPQKEHPSTYMVQDRSNQNELTRIQIQDQMLTAGMGGPLPEQPDPSAFQSILDVGCGTGGWLLETAESYPDISRLVGIDISERMITYALSRAESQQLSHRVEFHPMDAQLMFGFADRSFNMVNMRLGSSFLRTWDWPKILNEFQRVTQFGGVIRLTEGGVVTESSSEAMLRFNQLVFQALYQAGHFFTEDNQGITSQLTRLLQHHGLLDVQTRTYDLEYRSGTPQGAYYAENTQRAVQTLLPFLQKWTRVPKDYQDLCQQIIHDLAQPDFVAVWRMVTAWGTRREPEL